MAHHTSNPIFERLTQALEATIPGAARPFGGGNLPAPAGTEDESALRDWILRNHGRYGLDPLWILTGIGQPPRLLEAGSPPLAPVFAMSPIDPQTGRWRPLVRERIALAPSILSPTRLVVRMDDRGMEPRIRQGAYLVVDSGDVRIPEKSADGENQARTAPIFAVDVIGEGLVVRLVQHEARRSRLLLTGLDPAFPTLFLPVETETRVLGRVVWVAQTL
jgi:hypothetical protein